MRQKYPTFDDLIIDVGLPAAEVARAGADRRPDHAGCAHDRTRRDARRRESDGRPRLCRRHHRLPARTADRSSTSGTSTPSPPCRRKPACIGAATAAYAVQPDIAIALDVTFAAQPGVDADTASEMGGGPVIAVGPNFHVKLVEQIKEVGAARRDQVSGRSDPRRAAAPMRGRFRWRARASRPRCSASPSATCTRPSKRVDLKDITRTGRLLAQFIASLDADFLAAIDWDDLKAKPRLAS